MTINTGADIVTKIYHYKKKKEEVVTEIFRGNGNRRRNRHKNCLAFYKEIAQQNMQDYIRRSLWQERKKNAESFLLNNFSNCSAKVSGCVPGSRDGSSRQGGGRGAKGSTNPRERALQPSVVFTHLEHLEDWPWKNEIRM